MLLPTVHFRAYRLALGWASLALARLPGHALTQTWIKILKHKVKCTQWSRPLFQRSGVWGKIDSSETSLGADLTWNYIGHFLLGVRKGRKTSNTLFALFVVFVIFCKKSNSPHPHIIFWISNNYSTSVCGKKLNTPFIIMLSQKYFLCLPL